MKQYINLKKCTFMCQIAIFLDFVASSIGVEADLKKLKAIVDWSISTAIREVCSFHRLAYFY